MLRSIFTIAGLLAFSAAVPIGQDSAQSDASLLRTARDPSTLPREPFCAISAGCQGSAEEVHGDDDDGKRYGLRIANRGDAEATYFIYQNSCDCVPLKYVAVAAGGTRFVALAAGFQGRVVRGTAAMNLDGRPHRLGTWVEVNVGADDGVGWGNVSLIKGCDGAAEVEALDGTGARTGFDDWLLDGAPPGAYKAKDNGVRVIGETEALDNPLDILFVPRDYLAGILGYAKAYIDDHHGNPVIRSGSGRLAVTFYKGRT
ncbi:hypothetical protein F5X99DRAFT_427158 [Biscogniauxia marginata]|nr:hypothetical protein F5X99DRAFT_427158 [Biscogniauxia marginata]